MNKKTILLLVLLSAFSSNKTFAQWSEKTPGIAAGDVFWQINAPRKDSVYLMTNNYKLLRSFDGGDTWTQVAVPAELFDTIDFHYLNTPSLIFLDGKNGYIYGSFLVNGGLFLGGTEATWISRTSDGGETWESLDPIMPDSGFTVPALIKFFTPNRAVAFIVSGYGFDYVKTSDDGGKTWQNRTTLPISAIEGRLRPDGSGYVLAYNVHDFTGPNVIYATQDYGASWTLVGQAPETVPFPAELQGILYNFTYLDDAQNGFYITNTGTDPFNYEWHIARTQDGGSTWSAPELSWNDSAVEDFTVSESVAWVAGATRVFRREAFTGTGSPENTGASLSPNWAPGGKTLRIQMSDELSRMFNARIIGSDGRVVVQMKLQIQQGKGTLECPALVPGIYFMELNDGINRWPAIELIQP